MNESLRSLVDSRSKVWRQRWSKALVDRHIIDVRMPSQEDPLDGIELVLDNGQRIHISASSADGTARIAFGSNLDTEDLVSHGG